MPPLDVAKLVGAASAPVALIIATAIFQSNLGAKYALLAGVFRDLSSEFRETEEQDRGSLRAKSVHAALETYAHRLHMLMRAFFWLMISIICFVFTVVFTGVGVIFPKNATFQIITAVFSFAGLLILVGSVAIEIWENHQAKRALVFETSGIIDVLPKRLRKLKQEFHDDHLADTDKRAA